MTDRVVHIITPVGMIGYGYPIQQFHETCDTLPDGSFIIADAGSTDGGPQKLCFGSTTCPRESYVRDFKPMLKVANQRKFRVLLSSAGGAGANSHVDDFVKIIEEISAEEGYSFRVAKIYAEIDPKLIKTNIREGKVTPCGPVPQITCEEVDATPYIVAQMGAEPFMEALKAGADIIIAGRAYDPAPYAAVCLLEGIDPAIAWHMGKICECGALCASPKSNTIVAAVYPDRFILTPVDKKVKCTPLSVAAHTLYEKSRPDILIGPGGELHLQACQYEPLDERTTVVSKAVFKPMPYTVKLEGAKPLGFRTTFVAGIRDPLLIKQIDHVLPTLAEYATVTMDDFDPERDRIAWHVYGKNGVMGALEPDLEINAPMELCVIGEVLSSTQARANQIANMARVGLLHCPYPGQMATAGNIALPYAPLEQPLGPFCEFNIYHVMPIDDPLALFPIHYVNIRPPEKNANGHSHHDAPRNGHTGHGEANGFSGQKPVKRAKQLDRSVFIERAKGTIHRPSFREMIESGRTTATIAELASIVRSKNAGPFEQTFDIMFANEEEYRWVQQSGALNLEILAKAYRLPRESVVTCMFFDPAMAFKLTIPRAKVQGGFGETDMHGAQQHVPLARISVDLPRKSDAP